MNAQPETTFGEYFDFGLSGYGLIYRLITPDLFDEGNVKNLARDMLQAVSRSCLDQGARSLLYVKADFDCHGGTVRAHTIGPAHGIFAVGHLTRLATEITVSLSCMIQGLGEDFTRKAVLDGVENTCRSMRLEFQKDREHTYFNPTQPPEEGALLLNRDLRVMEATHQACTFFHCSFEDLANKDCWSILSARSHETLYRAIRTLHREQAWAGEVRCRRKDDTEFPAEIRVNWVEVDGQKNIQFLLRDVSEQRYLEEMLRKEQRRMRELNITLRNVMHAVESEKKNLEKNIAKKIEALILPTLDKAKNETSAQLRNAYLDIIASQLGALSDGVTHELESRFFKLTRAEMNICQLIQSGYTSKEIAGVLNISFDTVQTHRKNIRRKLGLRGRHVNLYSYLSAR